MTLNYITFDIWWDTDATILPQLCKKYKVNIFVENRVKADKYPQKENYNAQTFITFKPKHRNRDPRRIHESFQFFKQIRRRCRNTNATNLLILGSDATLLLLLFLFLPKSNTIIATHNYTEHPDSLKNTLSALCLKLYLRKFSRFLFFSSLQKEHFLNDHPTKQAHSITMPLKDFGQPTIQTKKNAPTFLFFGNVRPYKRPDIFIKAANAIQEGKAKFIIAGRPDPKHHYKTLIKHTTDFELHLRFLQNDEIPNLFARADFLVLPYDDATQSGPSLIAINYGIPIIASRLPAFERLISNGSNGYLFPSGDAHTLAHIFNEIIENGRPYIEHMKAEMNAFKADYLNHTNILQAFDNILTPQTR